MEYLENIIRKYGKVLPGDILKVDSFLNHQIDVEVMDNIGKGFAEAFKGLNPDKILTIETSGVAIAQATSINMNKVKIVYAKKGGHNNMNKDCYECEETSYTKGIDYVVKVSKEYLKKGEKVIIVDDFLANGEAMNALLNICKQAEVEVLGVGIVIAKMYQPGYERISKMCDNLQILAKVKLMSDDGKIEFDD